MELAKVRRDSSPAGSGIQKNFGEKMTLIELSEFRDYRLKASIHFMEKNEKSCHFGLAGQKLPGFRPP